MRRLIAGGAVGALAATLLTVGGVSPAAVAATGDGTISVTVVQDNNVNKERDGLDVGLEGVKVHIFDIDGEEIVLDTDANGVATLAAGDNTLTGGRYRVEVTNPNAAKYSEAQIADGHTDPQFAPAVSFVDVRGGKDATLTVGYVDYTTLGVDGARLYSAVFTNDVWPSQNSDLEVYSANYDMTGGPTPVTSPGNVGAVYGIGIDSENFDIYAGAYAKRGSLYGPGGSGAIYRINSVTGEWEIYTTVANAGDTEHDLGPLNPADGFVHHDFAFREAVGRESLGDVDITPDNKFLTTINQHTDELVIYPVQEELNPAPLQTLKIAAPASCESDWAPMGLGQRDGSLFVGAVCGSDMQAYVLEYERNADGTVVSSPITTRQGDVSQTVPRAGQNGPFGGIMDPSCIPVDWRVWTDEVPSACVFYGANEPQVAWYPQFVVPQPMLGDIEFVDSGEMVLSFRDRSGDQYGLGMYMGQKQPADTPGYGNVVATGDLVAFPADAATLDFANPAHDFQDVGAFHNQAAFSGITSVPGSGTLVSNTMDATGAINTNGLRAYDATTGNARANLNVTSAFYKGMGLADLEALVLEQTQQIGNRIWSDLDQDGIQDPNERGIAGVQVSLYDVDGNVVATTETDANGEYYFDTADGLLPDTRYEVRLDRASDFEAGGPLEGYSPTGANAGGNRGIDSNGVLNDDGVVVAAITSPKAGVNDHSIDFGFVPKLVSVGDYVWLDADRDGIQDAGETPVAGAEVILYDANGVEVARTTTDANGFYAFGDLEANAEYTIVFPTTVEVDGEQVPLTRANQGSDDGKDSDADPATGRVTFNAPADGNNSILPGEVDDPTIDAGYATPILVSVGDYLWIDADRDGVQDASEAPVAGAEVILYDAEGVEVARTTTDEDGYYAFPDLTPGADYSIQFPTTVTVGGKEYPLTKPGAGSDRGADSNPGADGKYAFTAPTSGENSTAPGKADDPTIDAGYAPPVLVSVGDYLWIDADRDGVQDASEAPVAGAEVILYDAEGVEVARTTTDENGYYAFPDLTPSTDYTIQFPTTVTVGGKEYPLTKQGAGSDRGADSNPGTDGKYSFTSPANGENSTAPGEADDPTIDAGYVPPVLVSVGDYLWLDADRDGVQDKGEKPVAGATVILYDAEGVEVARTTTDEDGYYAFPDLTPGADYSIQFPTTVTVGGKEYPLTKPGAGSDRGADSNPGADGKYAFTAPTKGNNSTAPGKADDPTIDAGYAPPVLVSVGDYVWVDADRDGIQDSGEKPLPGVEVKLFDKDGNLVGTTTTDEDGYYVFTDLTPGAEYTVQFPTTVTVGGVEYPLTTPGAGDDRGADSNAGADGKYTFNAPTSGENSAEPGEADDPTIDAGYVIPSVSVGDFVWLDTDRDGVQDAGEPGIPGVTLTLTGPDGKPVTDVFGNPVGPVTTDKDGKYSFENLPVLAPGQQYTVTVTPPAGYLPTLPGVGEPGTDSSTGSATSGDLTTDGARDDTLDFGFYPNLVSIGDYVWLDADGDGVQDPGEKPLPGVEVKLFDKDGNLVATTTTDENGFYVFTDLKPGTDYFLEFPTTVTVDGQEHFLTRPGQGTAGTDSNADPATGRVPVTTPTTGNNSALPGEVDDPTYDVGYALIPVVTPTPTPTPSALPSTGLGDMTPLAGLAALLLLAGAGAFIARRRTSQQ